MVDSRSFNRPTPPDQCLHWLVSVEQEKYGLRNDFFRGVPVFVVNIVGMDERRLDERLKDLSERGLPKFPETFNSGVWRSIRTRSIAREEDWFEGLVSMFLRPRWAAATLTVTLVIGMNLGLALADTLSTQKPDSLGLKVFAADSASLPSTLLSQLR